MFVPGEYSLADSGIDLAALPLVNWLGFFSVLTVGLILTFVKGPDGQNIFFNVLLILQIGGPIGSWIEIATDAATASPPSQVVIQVVATMVFLFAYFRLRSRL